MLKGTLAALVMTEALKMTDLARLLFERADSLLRMLHEVQLL